MADPNKLPAENAPPLITAEDMLRQGRIGHAVVHVADRVAEAVTSLDVDPQNAQIFTDNEEQFNEITYREVEHEKRLLSPLADDNGRLYDFSSGVDALGPPQFLKDSFGVKKTNTLVKRVITTDENMPAAVNFFQWYDSARSAREQQFQEQELPNHLHDFRQRLEDAAQQGAALPEAVTRLDALVDAGKLHVQLTDYLQVYDIIAGVAVFHNGERTLQINNEADPTTFEHRLMHELGHVIEGSSVSEDESDPTQVRIVDMGLGRIFGDGVGGKAIREATNELFTDALLHGNVQITDPEAVERRNTLDYIEQQSMIDVLCRSGLKKIDPKVLIRAAQADGNLQTSHDLQEVIRVVEDAYPGMDMINRISNLEAHDGESKNDAVRRFSVELEQEMANKKAA